MVDSLHECIEEQDIKINQLATMVNNLVGVVKSQKELEVCKKQLNDHCRVINTMMAKYMLANDHIELEKKYFLR